MKNLILITALSFGTFTVTAQSGRQATGKTVNVTQQVKGYVTDATSRQALAGVLVLLVSDNNINATTDANGYFSIDHVPVGRQSLQYSFMGYDSYTASEVLVISGKALDLNIALNESLNHLNEVKVTARKDRAKPINEYMTVSARSFSVEETRRYAASFSDPARMAMNFPGVSNSGDMDNGIVVRGNSPKGVLWRLEGIEIPNPNHFSSLGTSGGPISMLNANNLGTSDFYTGAFAPEIGNALSGAFDINLRNGNADRAEHTIQIGTLGAEIGTEGPLKIGKKASYLLNYRYSTLALLDRFADLGGAQPNYQDGSFKINLPTEKAGTFTVFGLGGYNIATNNPAKDSAKWDDDNPNTAYVSKGMMATGGVSHQYFLNKDAYLKTIVSASYDKSESNADTLNPSDGYNKVHIQNTLFSNTALRISMLYNQKINSRHSFRTGIIAQQLSYDMDYNFYDNTDDVWKSILSGNGSTQFYQAYVQGKSRMLQSLTFTYGLHGSYLALNGKYSIEPRASATWQVNNNNKITMAAGLHSKPEHISTYMFQNAKQGDVITYPNKNLDLLRAFHSVLGYETALPWSIRFKAEVYYQHLYSIPVEQDSASGFSIINAMDVFSLMETNKPMVSKGTGENYGIDFSLERPFINNYYILATASVYKSTYTDYAGNEFNTRFNRGQQVNLIGGKEFKVGHEGRKVLGLNGKILYSGGMRESKIDLNSSIAQRKTVLVPNAYFTQQAPYYFRTDASVYYKINNAKATHTIQLEVQNITNRRNYYFSYFDTDNRKIKQVNQLGIFPNITYRLEFHK